MADEGTAASMLLVAVLPPQPPQPMSPDLLAAGGRRSLSHSSLDRAAAGEAPSGALLQGEERGPKGGEEGTSDRVGREVAAACAGVSSVCLSLPALL